MSYSCSTYHSDNSAHKHARYQYILTNKIKWNHRNLWINHVNKEWLSKQIKVKYERIIFWKPFCIYFTTKLEEKYLHNFLLGGILNFHKKLLSRKIQSHKTP